ncbi:MAG: PQQ-dependent sugar dehydrogenase [Gemmataceae bacterium]|nr:PQQ-dependent sugar dehydrogenase [Gemmataceae bacterium]
MRFLTLLLPFLAAALLVAPWPGRADDPAKKPVGIAKRVPWTTSKVKGSPEPPAPYRTEQAFAKLPKFNEPLDMAMVPGTNRLAIAERRGKIYAFVNDPQSDKADLVLDLKKTIYALTFHPQFAKNGYLFVTYVLDPDKTEPKGTKVARFVVDPKSFKADPDSEKVVFEWPSGGHNGGCLKFGPDGYLYIGTGDGSGIADELQTGQDVSDLLSSILRIDVDKPDDGKPYGVPKDNPFVKMKDARPEIWAYGVRQPWKFSFDRANGDLWCGEVGQDLWESVLKVEKGGNYGWSVMEGTHPFRPERKRGPTPILPPVIEHPHTESRSLTGGFVYHGKRLKELEGAYIYGDFDTGRVWALRFDGKKVTWKQELAKTLQRVVGWGEDAAGELYIVDFMGGRIHQLVQAPKEVEVNNFPRKLSETGVFESTKELKPAAGLIPYSVNAQLWSDGAYKERFLAIPGLGQIGYNEIEYPQPSPGAPRGWRFSDGTVMVKTFFLEMEAGNPASRRRLETRLLHFQKLAGTEEVGDQYWQGYTYVWNDEQTDAVLAESGGLDRTFTIKDAKATGGKREQTWHFPSRNECVMCHTTPAKFALGVNTLQMNKDHNYNGVVANQLRTLEHLGIFTKPLPQQPQELPHLSDPDDEKAPIDLRARSYLQANCAHCHIKWGGGNAEFQLIWPLKLNELGIVDVKPAHGSFKIDDARLLVPGHPERSLLYTRMRAHKIEDGRMPRIGSLVVDEKGSKLIHDWIKQLPTK